MKNKKSIYVLVPLVILVWGIVGYKILSHVRDNKPVSYNYQDRMIDTTNLQLYLDTFRIKNNYSDPFLKYTFIATISQEEPKKEVEQKVTNTRNRITRRRQEIENRVQWPELFYNGVITNKKGEIKTVLLTINGKENLLNINSIVDGVKLLKVYSDSIKVEYLNEEKSISKKEINNEKPI